LITHNKSIAVFDSGLGSLSVIRGIRSQISKENILYFADKRNFPYGQKSVEELEQIMVETIRILSSFSPKIIVVASITPSIQMLSRLKSRSTIPILGVSIPLQEASRITKKKHIGILGTKSTINSRHLDELIRLQVPQDIFVSRFDASPIIEIIEKGIFLKNKELTITTISRTLESMEETSVDVLVLSSTHLSFIKSDLISMFPSIRIVDPILDVVKEIKYYLRTKNILRKTGQGRIRIIVNGDKDEFQTIIKTMGLPGPVESFQK
jgi:glutamate racemase